MPGNNQGMQISKERRKGQRAGGGREAERQGGKAVTAMGAREAHGAEGTWKPTEVWICTSAGLAGAWGIGQLRSGLRCSLVMLLEIKDQGKVPTAPKQKKPIAYKARVSDWHQTSRNQYIKHKAVMDSAFKVKGMCSFQASRPEKNHLKHKSAPARPACGISGRASPSHGTGGE